MNKKRILTIVFFISCFIVNAVAMHPGNDGTDKDTNEEKESKATWEFYSLINKPTAEDLEKEANFKFGQETGYLYNIFIDYYVVRETIVPGDPNRRTVIRKPAIYNAVRSIEKQIGKDLKNNIITKEQAATQFKRILKVAISAIDSDCHSFEEALQANRKNTEKLCMLFSNVKLTEI